MSKSLPMTSIGGLILSLAYILGLVSTGVPWGKFGFLALGVGTAVFLPRFWRTGPKRSLWLAAGLVGFLASLYFQVRLPQPAANDISKLVPVGEGKAQEEVVTVEGKIASQPRLTRSGRSQFWLDATQFRAVQSNNDTPVDVSRDVTGKLYVTAPLLQATGLYPGQAIAVTGVLYHPKTAGNPGGFDFRAYLAREGGFAGFKGRQITIGEQPKKHQWGWWKLQQRITRSQVSRLGSPEGQLVTSMVIGSKAVDLPYDIQEQFVQVGLAHALAASGFQVSLILSWLLVLTRRFSAKAQLMIGTFALVSFVGLTGMQPSVMRASVMGFGALLALVTQRKVKPLGLVLIAATLLLIFNPLWIWDLGFQLSFLATLGLVVTVAPLTKKLDWLPPAIASLIAVPIAATLWTLPLQLYVFNVFAPYSLAANITSTPFISVISLGGILSAIAALIWPLAGSTLAWLLYYPTHWLIAGVQFFNSLPGNSVALGSISLVQLLALYGLIGLVWFSQWWHRRWWLAILLAVALVALPIWQTRMNLFRVTVLATGEEQVLVIQDQGQVTLINSGDSNTVRFTVLPFLQRQGINQIDWGIALDAPQSDRSGWTNLLKRLQIKTFYTNTAQKNPGLLTPGTSQPLPMGKPVTLGSTSIKLISTEPPILQLQILDQIWLFLGELKPDIQTQLGMSGRLPHPQVLWWSGGQISPDLLQDLQPKVAIASATTIDAETLQNLQKINAQIYWTGRDGAIQWTPTEQFELPVETMDNEASLL
jgi:competence protein ComEC